uniref:Xylanase inhibitor N-terminal domain-containing protein n=1 Tax=Setaria digitata TaxID=48799 RepID=A0A915PQW5_9BILA
MRKPTAERQNKTGAYLGSVSSTMQQRIPHTWLSFSCLVRALLSLVSAAIAAQKCGQSSPLVSSGSKSINILIPMPYRSTFSGLDILGSGLGGVMNPAYFGYFTRYLGPANANGLCPAGVNINGQCWYDSIGNSKR